MSSTYYNRDNHYTAVKQVEQKLPVVESNKTMVAIPTVQLLELCTQNSFHLEKKSEL